MGSRPCWTVDDTQKEIETHPIQVFFSLFALLVFEYMYFKQLKPDFVCVRQGKGDVLNMMSCQEELCEGNPKSRHHWKDYLSKKCESAHKSKNQGKAPTTGCTLAFQWEVCQRRKLYVYTSWHRSFQLSQELFNLPCATTVILNFRLFSPYYTILNLSQCLC